ncbi:hypothetical protein [Acinetobacter baumannii]|uniref:hypothetical protein n=1 Tax=Acinetobacter baumannii TaxID=470 RepID=UPI0026472AB9|nr:hypothetical protein [Acinetobacter baumannii]
MIIAESIFSRIGNLRKVMSDPQIACLLSGTKGVESEHYKDLIIKVDDIVAPILRKFLESMPKTNQTLCR